jgi:ethanolamine utilization protein
MKKNAIPLETLIQKVTDEVYKKLKSIAPSKGQRLVILSSQHVPEIEERLGTQFDISYYNEGIKDCDCDLLLIPTICIQLLANLANGLSTGSRERFIFTMLLKGKKVFALEEGLLYRTYKQTAPARLYKMYTDFVENIKTYGIQIVQKEELLQQYLQDEQMAAAPEAEEKEETLPESNHLAEILAKKVVTEADLKRCCLKQIREIVIDQKSILTPLAYDYLREQQMIVHRR